MQMSTPAPSQKVTASAIAGGAVTLIIFLVNYYALADRPIPAEAATLAVWLISSAVAYFTPPSAADVAITK